MAAITPIAHVLTFYLPNAAKNNAFETTQFLNTLEDYAKLIDIVGKAIASKLKNAQLPMGASYNPNLIRNIQALCLWCSEQTCRGAVLDHNDFDAAVLAQAKVDKKRREEDKKETPQIKPDKFKPKNWKIWAKQFDLY